MTYLVRYVPIFLLLYAAFVAAIIFGGRNLSHEARRHFPLGWDFPMIWAGGVMASEGRLAQVYDSNAVLATERRASPGLEQATVWHYPPTFALIVEPLARLPAWPAYVAWMMFGGLVLAAAAAVMLRNWCAGGLAVAYPGNLINLLYGHTGFLLGGLFVAALHSLERRPAVAGMLIGVMTIKPQLGLLLPVCLVVGRHWTALAAAVATAGVLAGAALLAHGIEPYGAFVADIVAMAGTVASEPLLNSPSWLQALKLLPLPRSATPLLYAGVSLWLVGLVARLWARRAALDLVMTALAAASLAVTPYAFDYDMPLLAAPLAAVMLRARQEQWTAGEQAVLIAAWLSPLFGTAIPYHAVAFIGIGLQPMPFVHTLLVVVVYRRATRRVAAPCSA